MKNNQPVLYQNRTLFRTVLNTTYALLLLFRWQSLLVVVVVVATSTLTLEIDFNEFYYMLSGGYEKNFVIFRSTVNGNYVTVNFHNI